MRVISRLLWMATAPKQVRHLFQVNVAKVEQTTAGRATATLLTLYLGEMTTDKDMNMYIQYCARTACSLPATKYQEALIVDAVPPCYTVTASTHLSAKRRCMNMLFISSRELQLT